MSQGRESIRSKTDKAQRKEKKKKKNTDSRVQMIYNSERLPMKDKHVSPLLYILCSWWGKQHVLQHSHSISSCWFSKTFCSVFFGPGFLLSFHASPVMDEFLTLCKLVTTFSSMQCDAAAETTNTLTPYTDPLQPFTHLQSELWSLSVHHMASVCNWRYVSVCVCVCMIVCVCVHVHFLFFCV